MNLVKIKRYLKKFRDNSDYAKIYNRVSDYSMIPKKIFITNLKLAKRFESVKGDIVECGTWKGGMIAGIGLLFNKKKILHLFDSFEGLPKVKEIDGKNAKQWQEDVTSEFYFDNCRASCSDVKDVMNIAGLDNYEIYKGWFENTLKQVKFNNGISILRLDADWYESTIEILNNLFHKVNKGGIIIIDDYYTWEGCTKAVHDYLSKNKLTEKIRSYNNVCYIIKE